MFFLLLAICLQNCSIIDKVLEDKFIQALCLRLQAWKLFFRGPPFHFLSLDLSEMCWLFELFRKIRNMHTPTNFLLANMAASDVFSILLASISVVMLFLGFGKVGCKLTVFIEISTTVSSITLTVLAVERYHALMKRFRTELRLKEDNKAKAIAFTWIASVFMCSPGFAFASGARRILLVLVHGLCT